MLLSLDESRHLRDVLRLGDGDEVSVFNGEGKEFSCRIKTTGRGKEQAQLEILSEITAPSPESKLELTLAIALLKGEKFDLVVQKATELGVSRIVPLQTKRADIKIKNADEAGKKLERWRRIALEGAKQCGRARVPEIAAVTEFTKYISTEQSTKILFAERSGASLKAVVGVNADNTRITAIVGSEGGWEDSEIAFARDNNCHIVTLGGRILRAETAGIVVVTLLQHLIGDLN